MKYVFVYAKDGKIKVLDMEKSLKLHNSLIEKGWIQTASLNPCIFLEHLCNKSVTIEQDVKSLLDKP